MENYLKSECKVAGKAKYASAQHGSGGRQYKPLICSLAILERRPLSFFNLLVGARFINLRVLPTLKAQHSPTNNICTMEPPSACS